MKMPTKAAYGFGPLQGLLLLLACTSVTVPAPAATDAEVRSIVREMLAEKDAEISRLQHRLQELETEVKQLRDREPVPAGPASTPAVSAAPGAEVAQEAADEDADGLQISGFFDVLARTGNEGDRPFDLGAFEIDLEYGFADQFAVSSALVWDGGSADIAVAVIDYHLYDHSIPARGRIFEEPGFHLQAGRFDLPFAADFQYFAAPDRPTVTAPLTTERVQQGGFNSDGVRLYGSGRNYNYALYVIDSIYTDSGWAAGGRLGLTWGDNPFSLHSQAPPPLLEGGLSLLGEMDGNGALANLVYGADATLHYGMFTLIGEALLRDARQPLIDANGVRLEDRDEYAWHLTLDTDLEPVSGWPLDLFLRYGAWVPDYRQVPDPDDDTIHYAVDNLSRLSLGFGYRFNDYLRLKFEYLDTLGNDTGEPGFEHALGLGQIVVSF
ncbi:MAG: hypothetical protein D6786_08080 [Gammaproteobacteria bacterium]|nr:MAG: hypothetical protein D6786_08080 [Gammaproteobacteria bacterium]